MELVRKHGESELYRGGKGGKRKRSIGQEQKDDPTLKQAWEMAERNQGKGEKGIRIIIREGVLYRIGVDPKTQEEVDQLVIPKRKREEALRWTHDCPLGGHMREAATSARLLAKMYWPGIHADIKKFCETCGPCQLTQPKGKPGGELHPMSIIETPFERIAMVIVGPLPKGKGGYQYILVIIDYATRYPGAIPLRSTKAPVFRMTRS